MSDDGDIDESTRFFLVNIFHVEGVVIHGGSTFLIFDLKKKVNTQNGTDHKKTSRNKNS